MNKYAIFLILLCLTGCGMNELEDIEFDSAKSEMRDFTIKEDSQIVSEQLNLEKINVLQDISLINDDIYLLDSEPNSIKRYNLNGELIESHDLSQIPNPSLMKGNQEYIYIYDSAINKVFVLNFDYDIIHEISIKSIMSDSRIVDMEVYQDKVFLSADAVEEDDAVIVSYDLEGNEEIIVKNVNGYIGSLNGSLYMTNTLEYVKTNEGYGFQSGKNMFTKIYPEKTDVLKFPNAYMPVDFVGTESRLYVFNTSILTLDLWNLDTGEYDSTLLSFNGKDEQNIKLDMNEKVLIILLKDSNQLYKLNLE